MRPGTWRLQALPWRSRESTGTVATVGGWTLNEEIASTCKTNHEDAPSWWGGLVSHACQSDLTCPSVVLGPEYSIPTVHWFMRYASSRRLKKRLSMICKVSQGKYFLLRTPEGL